MQTKLKFLIFLVVAAILVAVVVVGYNAYFGQTTKRGTGTPYSTSLEPTGQPTIATTSTDKTSTIKSDLDTTTMSDLEVELKSLEDDAAGL